MTQKANSFERFWKELKRRRVIRVIPVYAVAAFIILQVAEMINDPLHLPEWTVTLLIVLLIVGFILAVILSWAYDISPMGINKTISEQDIAERNDIPLSKESPKSEYSIGLIESISERKETLLMEDKKPVKEKSIIVLPFENISPDPDQEYFSDGLTEEIITDLSHIHDLLVISRSSAMTFKGTKKTIPEIAQSVKVRFVLEGSVRKSMNNLRITAQLIDSMTDAHIWAEKYNGSLDDIFDIQEKVSRSITEALKLKLVSDEKQKLANQGTKSSKAYELCLRSRHYRDLYTRQGFNQAIEFLEQALIEDPNYALAYAEMAMLYWGLGTLGHISPGEAYPRLKEATMNALKIDKNLAEAHLALGYYYWDYDWNWSAAEEEFVKAVKLKPGDNWVHMVYSWFLAQQRQPGESIAEMRRALELDPLSISTETCIGEVLMFARETDLAIQQCNNVILKDATYWFTHVVLGVAYRQKGQNKEAVEAFEKSAILANRDIVSLAFWGYGLGIIGKSEEAHEILNELLTIRKTRYLSPFWIATVYMGLGEYDLALDWLQTGYEERAGYMYFINMYVQFDPLHDDPRLKDLCSKINLII